MFELNRIRIRGSLPVVALARISVSNRSPRLSGPWFLTSTMKSVISNHCMAQKNKLALKAGGLSPQGKQDLCTVNFANNDFGYTTIRE